MRRRSCDTLLRASALATTKFENSLGCRLRPRTDLPVQRSPVFISLSNLGARRNFFDLSRLNPFFEVSREPQLVTGKKEKLSDRYEVYDELGVGRFGVVREVGERATGKRFACKTIPKDSVEDIPELRNEVDILRRISHPHVLGIVDAF